jgi:hypothetical protein
MKIIHLAYSDYIIVNQLEQQGFMLWVLQKGFTNPKTGQSLQMDAIFVRKAVLKIYGLFEF